MPSVTERVYPDDMDDAREIQRILKEVFLRRYSLAKDWIGRYVTSDDARILDIACGSGYGTATLAELAPTVGVDIDAESIAYAKSHYQSERTEFHVGNADDIAFLNSLGRFDAIMSSGTIEHLDDPAAFLNWIRTTLRPGGCAVLVFPASFTKDWAWPFHKHDIRPARALELFAETGFEVHEKYIEGHRMRMRDLRLETKSNPELPVPPMHHWIGYYLTHLRQFAIRLYQITIGDGILFQDQEYLLTPLVSRGDLSE